MNRRLGLKEPKSAIEQRKLEPVRALPERKPMGRAVVLCEARRKTA